MAEHLDPFFTEQQLAMQLLASRGVQPTPENVSRALAALQANPELAARFSQGAMQRTRGGTEDINTINPVTAAFAEPFDVAFAKAVNGEQRPTAATEVATSPITQPAPPIVPVDQLALEGTRPQAPTPSPGGVQGLATLPGQVEHLPSDFDAVAQDAAEREWDIIPIIPAPSDRGLTRQAGRAAAQIGAQGALPSPPRALRGPQGALPEPQKMLPPPPPPGQSDFERGILPDHEPPQQRFKEGGEIPRKTQGVEADISRTIDVQDGPLKETMRAGKPAVEFELDGDRFWVNEDGIIGNDTVKVIVREQSVLDRVRAFLIQNKSRFATLARIF